MREVRLSARQSKRPANRRDEERPALRVVEGGGGNDPPDAGNADVLTRRFPRTDSGNAELFAALHGDNTRYDHRRRRWLIWKDHWWVPDRDAEIRRMAKHAARVRQQQREWLEIPDQEERARVHRWVINNESKYRLASTVDLAQAERRIADSGEGWDEDPWLLGVANGVVDLRTGVLRSGDRSDRITKHAAVAYEPDATAPTWDDFLTRIMDGKRDLITYLQRMIGYSLTGDTSEDVMFFLYGEGANGKSTLVGTIENLMGDYAKQAPPDLLLANHSDSHPTRIADLAGCRLVTAIEVERGKRLAEAFVKQQTGGDKLKGRFMRQDYFEFAATHKIFYAVNYRPQVRGTDYAIWRRFRIIPFTVTLPPEEWDKHLPEKLHAEWPGILRWAVQGCLEWQRQGLGMPKEVQEATAGYRAEMDVVGRFLSERCEKDPNGRVTTLNLYGAYEWWCDDGDISPESHIAFSRRLKEHSIAQGRNKKERWWAGIRLREANTETASGPSSPTADDDR